MKKRLLAIIAAAAMVVTMIPAMAFADAYDPSTVATVDGLEYSDLQEAIKAAAPNGTVEIVNDVTVDKWIMFAETMTISNGKIITLNINGLTINGNNHSLTVNSIESAGNGDRLFYDAQNLNINNLTIKIVGNGGGIGLQSGVLDNVTFDGGGYGVFPLNGEITIRECTFKTNSTAVYYEEARDNLAVIGCTFELADTTNAILLRGNTVFKDNTIKSARTVNVVSGSPVVSGNEFADGVRLKVYNDATAKIENNKNITNLVFDNEEAPVGSTFKGNELNESAEAALAAVGGENEPADIPSDGGNTPAPTPETPSDGTTDDEAVKQPAEEAEDVEEAEDAVDTGDNMNMAIPFGIAGLALAAMAAVVAIRRRTN